MALIDKLNETLNKLHAIGDAIRRKTGGRDFLTLDEMPNEIGSIVSGAEPVIKGLSVQENGVYVPEGDVDGFSPVTVNVPIPEGYIKPSGDISITANGEYDVTAKARAVVSVPEDHSVEDSVINRTLKTYTNDRITAVAGQAFWGCTSLKELILPNVETLSTNSVRGCTALLKVDFGNKVRTINTNVFYGCTKLTTLILRANSVCSLGATSAFTDTPIEGGTGYIYVPSALVESYKTATRWSTYANQFRAIEDYPDICG